MARFTGGLDLALRFFIDTNSVKLTKNLELLIRSFCYWKGMEWRSLVMILELTGTLIILILIGWHKANCQKELHGVIVFSDETSRI